MKRKTTTTGPIPPRPRAWSHDLEPVRLHLGNDPAFRIHFNAGRALNRMAHAVLLRRGLESAMRFVDYGRPVPIWPADDDGRLYADPDRPRRRGDNRPACYLGLRRAAAHFGRDVPELQDLWWAAFGYRWEELEEEAAWDRREARRRERKEAADTNRAARGE